MNGESLDIVIVGGGMVGASLAVTLLPLGLKVALIEATPVHSEHQPSFDERTSALSNGSRNVLTGMGLWPRVRDQATPIRRIHVSDRGRFGFARIDAAEQGVEALGYVLPNRALGAALWERLEQADGFRLYCPASVSAVSTSDDAALVRLQDGRELSARLVVAADGARSIVRESMGIGASVRDYHQTAVVTTVGLSRSHEYTAYERFTPDGPVALLPHGENRCAAIWALEPRAAQAMLERSDEEYLELLQRSFGYRLGRFVRVGRRAAYPLMLTQAQARIARRCVIIGNAAQGLHPIAGQGFNLGLRDVATLAEVIADEFSSKGAAADPGSMPVLERYDRWRRRDRRSIIAFTDGLVRLFTHQSLVVRTARNMGLLLFDLMPPAKQALSRLSLGFAGRLPRLCRGASLQ